jgi:endonuclease III
MPRKPKRKSLVSPARRDTSPEPYPSHSTPTPEQCLAIRDALLAFHGFPEEFAPFRVLRLGGLPREENNGDDPAQPHSTTVLDGLVITILSQNTTDAISRRAFASLKAAFPSWDQVSYKRQANG